MLTKPIKSSISIYLIYDKDVNSLKYVNGVFILYQVAIYIF